MPFHIKPENRKKAKIGLGVVGVLIMVGVIIFLVVIAVKKDDRKHGMKCVVTDSSVKVDAGDPGSPGHWTEEQLACFKHQSDSVKGNPFTPGIQTCFINETAKTIPYNLAMSRDRPSHDQTVAILNSCLGTKGHWTPAFKNMISGELKTTHKLDQKCITCIIDIAEKLKDPMDLMTMSAPNSNNFFEGIVTQCIKDCPSS